MIGELGAENLRVFINPAGVNPHYRQHVEETFRDAGVSFVTLAMSQFGFCGEENPSYREGQVVAFFKEGQLLFAGTL